MSERVTYEEIEILVQAYQDGLQDATEQLIQHYDGYFQKFLNVLHHNRFRVTDGTQRRFVASFLSNEDIRNRVHTFRKDGYVTNTLQKVAYNLRTGLSQLDEDEIKNEMVYIFLQLASTHNGKASFASYISYYFPLRLNTQVANWMKEYNSIDRFEVAYHDELIEAAHYDEAYEEKPSYFRIMSTIDTDFDENWINGHTCGELFDHLTPYERRVLKWYYEWRTFDYTMLPPDILKERKERLKYREQQIADLLGCSRKTINLKRNDIKRRVQEIAEDYHFIKR